MSCTAGFRIIVAEPNATSRRWPGTSAVRASRIPSSAAPRNRATRPPSSAANTTAFSVYRLHRAGLDLEAWDRAYDPDVEALYCRVLDEVRPDIVHVHHWRRLTSNLVEIATDYEIPTVVTLHDTAAVCPKMFRVRDGAFCELPVTAQNCRDCVERVFFHDDVEIGATVEGYREDFRHELHLAGHVVMPSQTLAEFVARHAPVEPSRSSVLSPGALSSLPSTATRRTRRRHGSRLNLVYWGGLQWIKGVHVLLRALRDLPDSMRYRLDLWGEFAADDADYRRRIEKLAMDRPVRFRGPFEPDTLPFDDYDLAVFPSVGLESYSFTVDEAWRGGLPVIVPDRGAPAERLGGGGATYRADDAEDLADVLARAGDDAELVATWRADVPKVAAFERHAEDVMDVYRETKKSGPRIAELDDRLRVDRVRRLQDRMRRRERTAYDLRGEARQQRMRADGLTEQADRQSEALTKKDRVLDDFNKSLADMTKTLRDRDLDVARLSADIETRRLQAEARIEHAEDAIRERDRELRDYAASVAALEQRLEAMDEKIVARDTAVAERTRTVDEFAESVRALEVRIAELTDELQTTQTMLRTESEHRAAAEALASSTAVELTQANATTEQLERSLAQARTSLERQAEQLADRRRELHELSTERDDLQTTFDRVVSSERDARAEASRLGRRLDDMRRRAEAFERAHGDEIERVETEVAEKSRLLALAVDDVLRLGGDVDNIRSARVETTARLLPIAEEVADGDVDVDDVGGVVDLVIRNHVRLHDLIRERDALLESFATEWDHASGDSGRTVRSQDGGSTLSTDVRASEAPRRAAARKLRGSVDGLRRRMRRYRPGQRLKLLFVIHDFLPKHVAGTEIYTYNLVKRLAERHDVHLLFCEARHEQERYTVSTGHYENLPYTEVVHNYQWASFEETYRDPRMDDIFRDVLDRVQPDLVHIQHLHYFSIDFIPIAKELGLPVVYTLHEFMLMCARGGQLLREDMEICERPVPEKCADCIRHQPLADDYGAPDRRRAMRRMSDRVPIGLRDAFERFVGPAAPAELDDTTRPIYTAAAAERLRYLGERMKAVDLFISPSAFLRERFVDVDMIAPDRIIHSDNGFDLAPFSDYAHRPSETLRFGFVGTIAEYKGVHVLVEAFDAIEDDGVELQIWGDVETFQGYKERLLPMLRNPRIKLRGRFDPKKIADVLADIDVLIVPSLWFENSPLTIHEAWLAGIPVIASDRGGMAELVEDEVGGLHFRLGDAEDLRAKIRRFIDDRTLVDRLRRGLGEVKDIDDNAREIEGYYHDLLVGARPAASRLS